MSSTASKPPIVLIHGMWMTPLSWEHWASHYTDRGHRVLAPAWPGLDKEPAELRRDPAPLRGIDITDIVDHYDKIIRGLDRRRSSSAIRSAVSSRSSCSTAGWASPAWRSTTAAPKGVLKLPFSTLRAAWPALGNPANLEEGNAADHGAVPLVLHERAQQGRVGHGLRPLLHPGERAAVLPGGLRQLQPERQDEGRLQEPRTSAASARSPAPIDRICPPSVNLSNFKQQRKAPSATDHKEYPGRCHWPGQDGWEEVADYVLNWTTEHARAGAAEPAEAPQRATTSPS